MYYIYIDVCLCVHAECIAYRRSLHVSYMVLVIAAAECMYLKCWVHDCKSHSIHPYSHPHERILTENIQTRKNHTFRVYYVHACITQTGKTPSQIHSHTPNNRKRDVTFHFLGFIELDKQECCRITIFVKIYRCYKCNVSLYLLLSESRLKTIHLSSHRGNMLIAQ